MHSLGSSNLFINMPPITRTYSSIAAERRREAAKIRQRKCRAKKRVTQLSQSLQSPHESKSFDLCSKDHNQAANIHLINQDMISHPTDSFKGTDAAWAWTSPMETPHMKCRREDVIHRSPKSVWEIPQDTGYSFNPIVSGPYDEALSLPFHEEVIPRKKYPALQPVYSHHSFCELSTSSGITHAHDSDDIFTVADAILSLRCTQKSTHSKSFLLPRHDDVVWPSSTYVHSTSVPLAPQEEYATTYTSNRVTPSSELREDFWRGNLVLELACLGWITWKFIYKGRKKNVTFP